MAISKLKLPDNSTQDINDARIASTDITQWNGKQDALVSGTNIKTVNNESLLGSGNLTVNGTPGAAGRSAILSKTTYTSSDTTVSSLAWDSMHVFPAMAELTISSFASAPSDDYEHELAIVFDTPSSVSSFSLGVPNTLHWANNIDLAQNISASTRYEVRISSSSMIAVYTETALS